MARCWESNPLTLRLLGVCPLLAVSGTLVKALTISAVLLVVMAVCNLTASAARYMVTRPLRPLFCILTASMVVALVDAGLRIGRYQLAAELGIYVCLLAANCLVLARMQEFSGVSTVAAAVRRSAIDGVGIMGLLVVIGALREFLAYRSLLGDAALLRRALVDTAYRGSQGPLPLMEQPAGAFLLLGLLLALGNWLFRATTRIAAPAGPGRAGPQSPEHENSPA